MLHRRRIRGMTRGTDGSTPRGQSLVEFALVLPMLLVLLLGIADFGRAFAMGIALEASARDAAEIGALERLRTRPPTDPLLLDAYYEDLHETISRTACEEMEVHPEPELAYQAGTECQSLSAVRSCIHDGTDTRCGAGSAGFDSIPAGDVCSAVAGPSAEQWINTSGGEISSHWVEVRVCYQFQSLIPGATVSLPWNNGIALMNIFLQRDRSFVIDCPPGPVTSC